MPPPIRSCPRDRQRRLCSGCQPRRRRRHGALLWIILCMRPDRPRDCARAAQPAGCADCRPGLCRHDLLARSLPPASATPAAYLPHVDRLRITRQDIMSINLHYVKRLGILTACIGNGPRKTFISSPATVMRK